MAIQILCETEGGLGNRLGSLVNALWLKEELKIDSIKLKWSKTYECGADWFELFNPIEGVTTVCDFNDSLKLANKTWIAISNETFRIKFQLKQLNETSYFINGCPVLSFSNPEEVIHFFAKRSNIDFIYLCDIKPFSCLSNEKIKTILKKYITPHKSLLREISSFCQIQKINSSVIGVHIRGTDGYGNLKNKMTEAARKIERFIADNKRVFICTDSQEIDEFLKAKFKNNIISHPKRIYPEKCDDSQEWREQVEVGSNANNRLNVTGAKKQNELFSNIVRSEAQIRSALCDMYILSRTQIAEGAITNSTFLDVAKYLSE